MDTPPAQYEYPGTDTLETLEGATHYRRYLTSLIASLEPISGVEGHILDFGAGIGTYAAEARALGWTVACVEVDQGHRARLERDGFRTYPSLDHIPDQSRDAIYSFNVLEHIEDDGGALSSLFRVMAPGGRLVLYVPAFPLLFSGFDRHFGHFRRYRRKSLIALTRAAGFAVDRCAYADCLGFPASLAYRLVSRRSCRGPGRRLVTLYDRAFFPLSRRLDKGLGSLFGKNLVLCAHRPLLPTAQR